MTTKVTLCPECRTDGGWHYREDGTSFRCPNIDAARLHNEALALTKVQNEKAFKAACEIVRDHAQIHMEFSGNHTREAMRAAQIPSATVGRAFTACEAEGVIENTHRTVRNEDDNTRHRIYMWKSLKHPAYLAANFSAGATGRQSA